ncbi:MAG TPA: peptidoglycan-binding protein [Acidimicrobiia bacterium]|nr:peptidoglycan-binding protein [Acidimicrobiia bacterium]
MRLYRVGDEGPAVRDIQDRLAALGFESGHDPRSVFGEGTTAAVAAFQKAKGLDVDGTVGPNTWRSLYEAGYRLGDRLLFLRRPMIRGEDVAELQSRLNSLGFDSGKVDGIFGPDTETAVIDFQHNRHLAEDGKVGPEVVTEIHLVTRGEMKEGRQAIRESEWLRMLPETVAGARVFLDADCRDPEEARDAWEAATAAALAIQDSGGLPMMSRSNDTQLPERLRARRANRVGSDLIIAFRLNREGDDCVFYFASDHSSSRAGQALAEAIAASIGATVEGRARSML